MTARELAFTAPKTVSIERTARPRPSEDELLIETEYSGISPGTELLIYRDQAPSDLPADATIDALQGSLTYPIRYGYSVVGEVIETGASVVGDWLGRRVFAFHPHGEHVTLPPASVVPVPSDIPGPRATLLPTAETAVNFMMDAGPMVGERAIVFGQGPVGLLTTALLADHPLGSVDAVEPLNSRRSLADRLGADRTYRPRDIPADPGTSDGDVPAGGDADLTFELSGNPSALQAALSVTGYAGRVLIGSWYGERPAALELGGRFHRSRIRLLSSQVSTVDPTHRGRWDKDRRLDVAWERLRDERIDAMITHQIPFEDASRAYQLLDARPDEAIQVVLTYD